MWPLRLLVLCSAWMGSAVRADTVAPGTPGAHKKIYAAQHVTHTNPMFAEMLNTVKSIYTYPVSFPPHLVALANHADARSSGRTHRASSRRAAEALATCVRFLPAAAHAIRERRVFHGVDRTLAPGLCLSASGSARCVQRVVDC